MLLQHQYASSIWWGRDRLPTDQPPGLLATRHGEVGARRPDFSSRLKSMELCIVGQSRDLVKTDCRQEKMDRIGLLGTAQPHRESGGRWRKWIGLGSGELGLEDVAYIYSEPILGPLHGPGCLIAVARCLDACLTERVYGDRGWRPAYHPRIRHPQRGSFLYQIHPRGKYFGLISVP